MTNRRRVTAWLLAMLVLFVTLVSGFEIAREAHHACTGEECRVCAHITVMREVLRVVSLALAFAAAAAAVRRLRREGLPAAVRSVPGRSPVFLKVRLLN